MALRLLVALMAMSLAVAAPAIGVADAAGQTSPVFELRGVNRLTAAGPASVDVIVPKDAFIEVRERIFRKHGPNGSVAVEGRGAFVGFVLQPKSSGAYSRRVVAGRFESCDKCPTPRTFNQVLPAEGQVDLATGDEVGRYLRVPAGTYGLHLISGGGPVSVRFELRGLSGHLEEWASEPDDASSARQLRPGVDTSIPGAWMAGRNFPTTGEGIFLSNLFFKSARPASVRWGICEYTGPAPPEDLGYGPHCTVLSRAGWGAGLYSPTGVDLDRERGFVLIRLASFYGTDGEFPPNPSGERGIGAWLVSEARSFSRPGAQGVFIKLAD